MFAMLLFKHQPQLRLSLYGTHNSWNGEQGANINTSNNINIANQRKWVASFSSDGLKVKGSAAPITANVTRSS